jgi:hypothetical protein
MAAARAAFADRAYPQAPETREEAEAEKEEEKEDEKKE